MLFKVDYNTFLIHMIDHFTREELIEMEYLVISTLQNTALMNNVVKVQVLYPSFDLQTTYKEHQDKNVIKEDYFDELKICENILYNNIVLNVLNHKNIVIMCTKEENDYIDLLTEYVEKKYHLHCIDLNKLFREGELGPIYIDRDDIRKRSRGVALNITRAKYKSMEATPEGVTRLIKLMNKKEKIEKLDELGIKINKADHDDIDKILYDAWVEEN